MTYGCSLELRCNWYLLFSFGSFSSPDLLNPVVELYPFYLHSPSKTERGNTCLPLQLQPFNRAGSWLSILKPGGLEITSNQNLLWLSMKGTLQINWCPRGETRYYYQDILPSFLDRVAGCGRNLWTLVYLYWNYWMDRRYYVIKMIQWTLTRIYSELFWL